MVELGTFTEGRTADTRPKTHSCLVVDDDATVQRVFQLALQEEYTLYVVGDGQAALRLLGRYPIDLVFLELRLPDHHGIEVLRRLRRLTPALPVIIVTAHSSHEAAVEAANLAVVGYVTKPFDVDDLKRRVKGILHRSGAQRGDPECTGGQQTRLAAAAARLIRAHHGEKLTLANIAGALHVAPRRLNAAFRAEWGCSVKDYLIRVRIEHARRLLRETDQPVKAIACAVGYRSLAHFYGHFQRLTGQTPCDARRFTPPA